MTKFISRKFLIAISFTLTASTALFMGLLSGTEFAAIVGVVLGAFTAGDVALNAIHKKNAELDND